MQKPKMFEKSNYLQSSVSLHFYFLRIVNSIWTDCQNGKYADIEVFISIFIQLDNLSFVENNFSQ